MKVAFVVHQYPPRFNTGTEIYAHRMAKVMRGKGHDVRVFTREPNVKGDVALRVYDEPVDDVPVTRLVFFEGLAPNHALHDYYDAFLGKVFGEWLDRSVRCSRTNRTVSRRWLRRSLCSNTSRWLFGNASR